MGGTMNKPGDVAELKKMLRDKMESEGWDNVRNFCKQTRIPISSETVRRALHDEYTNLEAASLAIICRYLRFTNAEIRDILKTYTSDRDRWRMISADPEHLSIYEVAVANAYRKIVGARGEFSGKIADYLEMVGEAAAVDIKQEIGLLRRGGGKWQSSKG